jgi:hypothetical protein
MTSAKKTAEVLKESLKKAQEKAAAIRKQLKATEQADRAKRALSYWKVIHDTALAKKAEIPTPEQLKKILINAFLESSVATTPAKKSPKKKAASKRASGPAVKTAEKP